ncbi:MAG: phosphatase PAP2 family protein [Oscillospiraceae bacterium]|nr:phosphatase PAP2 family protein [Oscillospiraceae bacterium]
MNIREKRTLLTGLLLLAAFVLWTMLIRCVDVQPLGQNGTDIGFATLNCRFHRLCGVHMTIYTVTDWLGLVPIAVCLCFGGLGLSQLLKRRSLLRVDPDLILLGIYYLLVIAGYLLFESIPINYRPIPINGVMEASYPSSTTLLVLSVMPTLNLQVKRRIGDPKRKRAICAASSIFMLLMVVGRTVAGVHWLTDILGAVLLSAGLFTLYKACVMMIDRRRS